MLKNEVLPKHPLNKQ